MMPTQNITTKCKLKIIFRIFAMATIASMVHFGTAQGQEKEASLQMELPPADVPQPQLFCGYCHVLTYPGVVQKGYELWKKAKHNKFGCVECHYPPREVQEISPPVPATEVKPGHIPQKPPERFSYLQLGGETIKTRPRIIDASCMTAACHGKPDDKFKTKKIKFTEKVLFVHEPHLDQKKQIEGQQLNCTSCHQHETDNKKFEVTKASCIFQMLNSIRIAAGANFATNCLKNPSKLPVKNRSPIRC
jgi:cytochrome c